METTAEAVMRRELASAERLDSTVSGTAHPWRSLPVSSVRARSYLAYRLQLPERLVLALSPDGLPEDWRDRPVSAGIRLIGDGWVRDAASVALSVPSVLVPPEHNFVLNPAHPEFPEVEIDEPLEFSFDTRLAQSP